MVISGDREIVLLNGWIRVTKFTAPAYTLMVFFAIGILLLSTVFEEPVTPPRDDDDDTTQEDVEDGVAMVQVKNASASAGPNASLGIQVHHMIFCIICDTFGTRDS